MAGASEEMAVAVEDSEEPFYMTARIQKLLDRNQLSS
jgi:hypothetical protein